MQLTYLLEVYFTFTSHVKRPLRRKKTCEAFQMKQDKKAIDFNSLENFFQSDGISSLMKTGVTLNVTIILNLPRPKDLN